MSRLKCGGGRYCNSVRLKELVGVEDIAEAAALDNRNFIRVMIGNEPYLALLDPGATISLVGSRILNKYRDRLRTSSGQVKGVSGAPMKVQGNLRISIDVESRLGILEFRAVVEISHDIILGMAFRGRVGFITAVSSKTMEVWRLWRMASIC